MPELSQLSYLLAGAKIDFDYGQLAADKRKRDEMRKTRAEKQRKVHEERRKRREKDKRRKERAEQQKRKEEAQKGIEDFLDFYDKWAEQQDKEPTFKEDDPNNRGWKHRPVNYYYNFSNLPDAMLGDNLKLWWGDDEAEYHVKL